MPWIKLTESTLTFECDTCDEAIECDVATVRRTSVEQPTEWSDFSLCWRYLQGLGWRSFKRVGQEWTFHCVACGDAAEAAHIQHRTDEQARDQFKARNAA